MHLYQNIVLKKKKRHKIYTYPFNPLINVLKCEQISAIPLRPWTITSIFFVYVFLLICFTTSCNLTGLFLISTSGFFFFLNSSLTKPGQHQSFACKNAQVWHLGLPADCRDPIFILSDFLKEYLDFKITYAEVIYVPSRSTWHLL